MNLIVRVKVIPNEDIDAILVNETFPSVSSMNVADDIVGGHCLICLQGSAKIAFFEIIFLFLLILL